MPQKEEHTTIREKILVVAIQNSTQSYYPSGGIFLRNEDEAINATKITKYDIWI